MFGPGMGIGGNAPGGGGTPGGARIWLGEIPGIPGGAIIGGGNGGRLGGPLGGPLVVGFAGVGVPGVLALYLGR